MKKCLQALFLIVLMIFFSSILCVTPEEIKRYPEMSSSVYVQDFPTRIGNSPVFYMDGFGAGFFANNKDNPYIITNRHVMIGGKGFISPAPMKIGICDEKSNMHLTTSGTPVCYFKNIDVGIIQIHSAPPKTSFVTFSSVPYEVGDEVHYFGQPGVKGRMFLYHGRISCLNVPAKGTDRPFDSMNTQAIGGNSGAPIMNKQGKCVGVLSCTIENSNQTFFVNYKSIKEEFDKAGLGNILTGTFKGNLSLKYEGLVVCH